MHLPRQTTTFSLGRTLSCYSLVKAFKDLPEFRRQRRLDDVLTTLRMPRSFAGKNVTSGRRRRCISSSMLKVPNSLLLNE